MVLVDVEESVTSVLSVYSAWYWPCRCCFECFYCGEDFFLVSRNWTFFSELSYLQIMGVGCLILIPLVGGIGFWDYKKGFFNIECSVHTEENPYADNCFTAKEQNIFYLCL